mgnify:CR=1 FL=1
MKLLIIYDYFYPASKAGGIVRSLYNLSHLLAPENHVYVYTSNIDLDGSELPVENDKWVKLNNVLVYYALEPNKDSFYYLIEDIMPEMIYFSGIFTPNFIFFPLLTIRRLNRINPKIVIAPRGMLQKGALSGKWFKKKIYLMLFKLFGLHKNIYWHATDETEVQDIQRIFGLNQVIKIAHNIPTFPLSYVNNTVKWPKRMNLVYLSLITSKKNLSFILELLSQVEYDFSFDIYGPVKDHEFWQKCQNMIDESNKAISYKGDVNPEIVFHILDNYHFFILPTNGENFGHAIFEALAAGVPVIISDQTPWRNLESKKAGWDIPLNQPERWLEVLEYAYHMDQEEYNQWSFGARRVAEQYMEEQNFEEQYGRLFSVG